ncbi:ethanolamine kinase 1-like [Homarus americanus]|uniref:ethanolamine kinase 1-like n=1 Tax=Homarus americanus TaxID=6706 RepID=UPI001C43AEBD|nr:ethanolamine kinase 1-like [Homarus americanus]XP_042232220.1 ethanolamine kinase 1-like [Homarus americanus]
MTPKLELTVDGSSVRGLQEGAKEIVQHVQPDWKQDKLEFKVYTEGITNQLIGVWCEDRNSQLLVRVYGCMTEMFIDRNAEKKSFEVLHRSGCCPPLYATFSNGLCYGFTQGSPISPDLVVQEPIWRAISQEMARYHKIKVGDVEHPVLFPKLQAFLKLTPSSFEDVNKQMIIDKCGYNKSLLSKEVDELESCLTGLGCPVVFSHNDILLGNVIWNQETQKVGFIDYEYGGANFQPFDVANHFNEFAGVDVVDYNRYPSAEFQRQWLRSYLSHYQDIPEEEVKEHDVELWYVWVNKFALASHLFWGSWAMVQANYSSIDFDFLGYGITRVDEYFKRKNEFLSLTPNL